MLKEFKEFISKGNVVDLAVGVIIGAAFGKIVSSFVADVLMPPLGVLLGQIDFKHLTLVLQPAVMNGEKVMREAVELRYGLFINNVIDFVIVAFAIFVMVKAINRLKREPPPPPPNTRECPKCLSSIAKKASRCAFCTSEVAPAA